MRTVVGTADRVCRHVKQVIFPMAQNATKGKIARITRIEYSYQE